MSIKKRVGILGGTFNPPHNGHLNLARTAVKEIGLEQLFLVPTYLPPHKSVAEGVSPADRAAMTRLAIKGRKGLKLSLFEIYRKRKTFTITTLRYFKKRLGKSVDLYFLIGSDSLEGLGSWREIGKAVGIGRFVVFGRPGYPHSIRGSGVERLPIEELDISSTEIRRLVKEGRPITKLVPPAVEAYIKKNGLYR